MAGAWIWRPLEIRRERSPWPGHYIYLMNAKNDGQEWGCFARYFVGRMFWQEWPCELVISTIANRQLPIDIKFYVYIMRDREQCLVDNG